MCLNRGQSPLLILLVLLFNYIKLGFYGVVFPEGSFSLSVVELVVVVCYVVL